jgi:hypothetical protein
VYKESIVCKVTDVMNLVGRKSNAECEVNCAIVDAMDGWMNALRITSVVQLHNACMHQCLVLCLSRLVLTRPCPVRVPVLFSPQMKKREMSCHFLLILVRTLDLLSTSSIAWD